MKKRTLGVAALSIALLAGCSSADSEKQKNLEIAATNRAALLSSELPLEYGPLHILRANSKGSMIEMMMVYNTDAEGAKPIRQVLSSSEMAFCHDKTIIENLTAGITYRIKMRNSRGKLMVDQVINTNTCDVLLRAKSD